MDLAVFELLCLPVIAFAFVLLARRRGWGATALDYGSLAVASLIGEATCIAFYGHYSYAPGWHVRLLAVPLLVPLIWPLVILSGREVALALGVPTALVVLVDASLVEVVAVRAGLWSWSEGGHLGVPLAGIAGWAFFALAADLALSRRPRVRFFAVILVAPLATHALIVASWWGFFRWTLRGELGEASTVAVALAGLVATAFTLVRRRSRTLPPAVAWPRIAAAALFFVLLGLTAPREVSLWVHALAVAGPYLAATRLT